MNSMDRPLDDSTIRRRRVKRVVWGVAIAAAIGVAVIFGPGWVRPTVHLSRVRTATVERNAIEATVTAVGNVVPRREHVITSPIDSRVQQILLGPGAAVATGEPILVLATEETVRALEKLDEQIALEENGRRQARIDLQRTLNDLEGRRRIKVLELESFEFDVEKNRRLHEAGLITEDVVRSSVNDANRAKIETEQLAAAVENEKLALEARLEGLDLKIRILRKDRADAAERLRRAAASSDRDGIVTWTIPEEGMAVTRGMEIARIADLTAFRVEATLPDIHSERIAEGQPAEVRIGDHRLRARVAKILPTVENGTLSIEVELEEPSHSALRNNLRVDVLVVTARRENALFVPRGSFVNLPDGGRGVFVIRDGSAVRTPVEFGISNFDSREVLRGLTEGERVIISDMSDFAHAREVRIR